MPIAEACQVRELPLCWLCRPGGSIIQIIATTLADITTNHQYRYSTSVAETDYFILVAAILY